MESTSDCSPKGGSRQIALALTVASAGVEAVVERLAAPSEDSILDSGFVRDSFSFTLKKIDQ